MNIGLNIFLYITKLFIMGKQNTKDFLTKAQTKQLEKLGYNVKPKMFRNIFYKDELPFAVWESLCEISGVSTDASELTLLSVAYAV